MQTPPSIDRRFFQNNVDALQRMGCDVAKVCAHHGLAYPLAAAGDRIPLESVSRLYDCIAESLQDPAFMYRLVNEAFPEGAGILYDLLICCPTPQDALRLTCRYSAIASDVVAYSIHERGRHVDLLVTPNRSSYVSLHQIEAAVFVPLLQYRRFLPVSRTAPVAEVFFTHAPRFALADYAKHYQCPVHFGQPRNGLRWQRDALHITLPGADTRLQAYYRTTAERYESALVADDMLPARVQRLFLQRMAFGEPDRADIARALNTSVRTLQRQLHELGLSYRALIEDVRFSVARQELTLSDRPVQEIAFLLGYADVRSFRRAFQRWAGAAPMEYRSLQRG